MNIKVLTNDESLIGFVSEHGLSIYIQFDQKNILFDLGQTKVFQENADKLNLDLNMVEHIVLSHGHYDHAGGLKYFKNHNGVKKIYLHKDAFNKKYKIENALKYNGIPYQKSEINWAVNLYNYLEGYNEIMPNIYLLGNVPHIENNEKYLVEGNVDDFHDEMILVIEENNELSVFVGCSHFGIINGLKAVKQEFPNKKIKNVIGGMHLVSKPIEEIKIVANELEKIGISYIYPMHCTGNLAINYFKSFFKEKCIIIKAGNSLKI